MPDLAARAPGRQLGGMIRHRSLYPLLLLAASFGVAAGSLEAQTILALDFDPNAGNFNYGYAFAGYGGSPGNNGGGNVDVSNGTATSTEIALGAGISGSNALRINMDASAAGALLPPDRTYDYLGFVVAGNTGFAQSLSSGQLADYTFTLTTRAEGFLAGVTSGTADLYVSFYAPDDTLGGDADTNSDFLLKVRFAAGVALAETFQTSSVNLGAGTLDGGAFANFTNFFAVANELLFEVSPNEANGRFGFDAGNAVVIDDVSLMVVPEPAGALSLALGGLVLAGTRRRGAFSSRARNR